MQKDETNKVISLAQSHPLSLADAIDLQLRWPNELHRLIAHHFLQNATGLYDEEHIARFIKIWNAYAQENNPVSQKLGTFPSALEYLLCQNFDYPGTQSGIAKKYQVSASTLTHRADQLFFFLKDHVHMLTEPFGQAQTSPAQAGSTIGTEREMARIHALLAEQNFETMEEANAFLQQNLNKKPSAPRTQSKEEQAADLLYSAWDEQNPQRRIKLAQDALKLQPESGDAYNILAECATSPKEVLYLYKQGMLVEEKRLGKDFFEENKGYFWGYMPTRPYMRAKLGYADVCAEMDNMSEAIRHYNELLELNPNDNQGVRDRLLTAYLETEKWKEAELLLKQYEEDISAAFNYSRILAEFGLNGITPKLKSLIKEAVKQNPFVPPYLQGKKRLPGNMPQYVGFGDESEAISYAATNQHLWVAKPELLNLLKK